MPQLDDELKKAIKEGKKLESVDPAELERIKAEREKRKAELEKIKEALEKQGQG